MQINLKIHLLAHEVGVGHPALVVRTMSTNTKLYATQSYQRKMIKKQTMNYVIIMNVDLAIGSHLCLWCFSELTLCD